MIPNYEMIAKYIEGNLTSTERNDVRHYLCEHPEEMENILILMDNDTKNYLNEYRVDGISKNQNEKFLFSDITFSAAAFSPVQSKKQILNMDSASDIQRKDSTYQRLTQMLKEIKDI